MTQLFDYWRSSAGYRVRLALALLAEDHSAVPVDLVKAEQTTPANLARNPQGLVPTLEIDGLSLTQSLAIIEYLNDTRGGFLPADPVGLWSWRWVCAPAPGRCWCSFLLTDCSFSGPALRRPLRWRSALR